MRALHYTLEHFQNSTILASTRQPLIRVVSRSQSTLYVCNTCRSQLLPSRTGLGQSRSYASKDNLPFTEKVRRKIWGTDNPPGLADPYGGPSFLEKRKMRREAASRGEKYVEQKYRTQTQLPMDEIPEAEEQKFSSANRLQTQEEGVADEQMFSASEELEELERSLPIMEEYKPAETTEGLEEVGHLGHWTSFPEQPQDQYSSWLSTTTQPASNRRELLSCLHQAVVECISCKEAGIDQIQALSLNPAEVDSDVYATTKINISPSGLLTSVDFASEAEKQQLSGQLATATDTLSYIEVSHYTVTDEEFLSSKLTLQDPITFQILKRFSQLSGHKIPDPVLNVAASSKSPKTLAYLLDSVHDTVVKPQPKNLAEVLMNKQSIQTLGNVMVIPRRETPVDKEKEVGRWKVIERELKQRGLPVLGKLHA